MALRLSVTTKLSASLCKQGAPDIEDRRERLFSRREISSTEKSWKTLQSGQIYPVPELHIERERERETGYFLSLSTIKEIES